MPRHRTHQIRALPCTPGPTLRHLTCVDLLEGRLDLVVRELNPEVLQRGNVTIKKGGTGEKRRPPAWRLAVHDGWRVHVGAPGWAAAPAHLGVEVYLALPAHNVPLSAVIVLPVSRRERTKRNL